MRYCLRVIPDMGAGAVTAAGVVAASFPRPKLAVGLAQHGGGFQDGEVGGDGFEHLGRKRGIVEAVTEPATFLAQLVVMVAPIETDAVDVREPAGVPRTIVG